MYHIRTCTDPEKCQRLWEMLWPEDGFFDLWPVRSCFNQAFKRPPSFQVFEKNQVAQGMVALCWIKEDNAYGQFPGETWKKKTWLEQNRIISRHPDMSAALIDSLPRSTHLRYLIHDPFFQTRADVRPDEVGYLFLPGQYHYSFARYMDEFSGKTRKKIHSEISKLEKQGVTIQHDRIADVDLFFQMNIQAFGTESYFSDNRFLSGFQRLVAYLADTGMIRITSVLIGGKTAAVDLGAVYKNTHTILAGGTCPEFKGVAKLINLHHIRTACAEKMQAVDFLCGDFNWKKRFHLTPRPLYGLELDRVKINHLMSASIKDHKICA